MSDVAISHIDGRYYPAYFYAKQADVFGWFVCSRYADGIERAVAGPFWRAKTAFAVEAALTRHFRNGYDLGVGQSTGGKPSN